MTLSIVMVVLANVKVPVSLETEKVVGMDKVVGRVGVAVRLGMLREVGSTTGIAEHCCATRAANTKKRLRAMKLV